MVVKVEQHVLILISDTTKEHIRVFADDVVESSVVTTGVTKIGEYELRDLVLLDNLSFGVIIRVESEAFQFINHLINLLARHQFLKIAYQLEKKKMLGAYSLLKVVESELQAYLSATEGRVGHCLALIQAASDVPEQGGVHDSDNFLHAIRDLLKVYSNTQAALSTYVSAPGIVQQISALHSDLMSLQSEHENSLPEDRNSCINELMVLHNIEVVLSLRMPLQNMSRSSLHKEMFIT